MYKVFENENKKIVKSDNYNSIFDKNTGFFARWGRTIDEDVEYCGWLPEILDLEISQGKCSMNCKHCYKSNGEDDNTHHMSFETFKNIFHKVANTREEITFKDSGDTYVQPFNFRYECGQEILNKKQYVELIKQEYRNPSNIKSFIIRNNSPLQQIAFGITDVNANPDFFKMMRYARNFGIIPNYTTNGMFVTEEIAKETAEVCGAVAVSVYSNKNIAYDAIKKFTDAGMTQVNVHYMLSEETCDRLYEVFNDIKNDDRLKRLNAIVLLGYKPKGSGVGEYNILSNDKFKQLVNYALDNEIRIGFDSCTCHKFLNAVKDRDNYKELEQASDPCESSCFSSYINCFGEFYSCSFCEGEGMWKEGINVLECKDFSSEAWNHPKTQQFREMLLKNGRKCPMFSLDSED